MKYPMQKLDNAQYRLTCAIRLTDAVQVCMESGARVMEECAEALYGANNYLWSLNSEMREAIDSILEERSNSNGENAHEGQGEFDQQGEETSNRALSEDGGRAHLGGFVWVYRPVWCRWPSYQLRDKGSLLFHSSRAYRRIARWYSSLTPPREKLETITVPSFSLYFRRAFSLCKSSRFSRIERPAGQHRPQVKYTAPVQRLPVPKTPDPISQG